MTKRHFLSRLVMVFGVLVIIGGISGFFFTYQSVVQENIITPNDASIPGVKVRGILTLKSQADIIRKHTLEITDGKTFAEMPRYIPKMDNGDIVRDESGEVVMVPNETRNIWITATTLTTSLYFGIFAYIMSAFVITLGITFIIIGYLFLLSKEI